MRCDCSSYGKRNPCAHSWLAVIAECQSSCYTSGGSWGGFSAPSLGKKMGVSGALLSRDDVRADCTSVGTSSLWLPDTLETVFISEFTRPNIAKSMVMRARTRCSKSVLDEDRHLSIVPGVLPSFSYGTILHRSAFGEYNVWPIAELLQELQVPEGGHQSEHIHGVRSCCSV